MARDFRADPRKGDMIVPRFGHYRVARQVIHVGETHVTTSGMAGGMRNTSMKRERLARYDLVESAEQAAERAERHATPPRPHNKKTRPR